MRIITTESEHPKRFISFSDGSGPLARWNGTIAELPEYAMLYSLLADFLQDVTQKTPPKFGRFRPFSETM